MKRVPLALVAGLLLAGCGQDGAADKDAEALDRAADHSAPEAGDILRNAEDAGNAEAPAGGKGR